MSSEKSAFELDLEALYAQASGRKWLMAAGILHMAGVALQIFSQWQDMTFILSLVLSGEYLYAIELFYFVWTIAAITFQLVCGITCIIWRNTLPKSKIVLGLAIAVISIYALPFIISVFSGADVQLNLLSFTLPSLHFIGALKNNKDRKELEMVKRRELGNKQA